MMDCQYQHRGQWAADICLLILTLATGGGGWAWAGGGGADISGCGGWNGTDRVPREPLPGLGPMRPGAGLGLGPLGRCMP